MIDSVIFTFLIVTLFLLVPFFENAPRWIVVIVILLPIFILEPVLVSLTGGTIGHHLIKIKVQNVHNNRNINIILATLRFIIKSALGWVSLISVLTTRRHQAIHDFLVNSVVVYKDAKKVPTHEALTERVSTEEDYVYPSILRRLVMVVIYNIILFMLLIMLSSLFVSDICIDNDICTTKENLVLSVVNTFWILSFLTLLIAGWKSRLWGCRRKRNGSGEPKNVWELDDTFH